MSRSLRRVVIAGVAVLVAAVAALGVLARLGANGSNADARSQADRVLAPLAIGTELQRPPRVPDVSLLDAAGHRTSLTAWRGRWVVLAPSMTLCHEVCPMTTGALMQLTARLRRAGLAHRVVVAEATVDPWRDTPARLRAYRRLTGVDFQMLTGSRAEIRRLWRFFGVDYHRVPQDNPPDTDWMTHRPETFDVDHTDGVFFISPSGQERVADEGMPDVHDRLSRRLRSLLTDEGRANLAHPQLAWTAQEAYEDVAHLMGRMIPAAGASTAARDPSAAQARRQLTGSPRPLAAIHAQAGRLITSGSALTAELHALRGHYPIVLNVWASWCPPCQEEMQQFGAASARFGRRVAFLGADADDPSPSDARRLLARHPVSYPSFVTSSADLGPLGATGQHPITIYIGQAGKVDDVHIGPYQTAASLDNDIERYGLGIGG